jgi:hypothetical protein
VMRHRNRKTPRPATGEHHRLRPSSEDERPPPPPPREPAAMINYISAADRSSFTTSQYDEHNGEQKMGYFPFLVDRRRRRRQRRWRTHYVIMTSSSELNLIEGAEGAFALIACFLLLARLRDNPVLNVLFSR